ncbi:hypothetical protein V8E54_013304 [Elaphomyces granulatus]
MSCSHSTIFSETRTRLSNWRLEQNSRKKACAFAELSRGNAGSNGIINGSREGAVALQALGCIDFSDARRRQGVVKGDLVAGRDFWRTFGISSTDGPNAARGSRFFNLTPGVCLSVGLALASTWNIDLMRKLGGLLADESIAKQ